MDLNNTQQRRFLLVKNSLWQWGQINDWVTGLMWPKRACPLRRRFSQRFSQRAGEQLWWMKASGFSRSGCGQAQGERPEPGRLVVFPTSQLSCWWKSVSCLVLQGRPGPVASEYNLILSPSLLFQTAEFKMGEKAKVTDTGGLFHCDFFLLFFFLLSEAFPSLPPSVIKHRNISYSPFAAVSIPLLLF